jgi:hypothetical protein
MSGLLLGVLGGQPTIPPVTVTGGTETTSGGYRIHTFTSSGTLTVTGGTKAVEYLVLAGGGGTGSGLNSPRGGAGGMLEGTTTLSAGAHTFTVGAGGAADVSGSNSEIPGITATGGGGGNAASGGSGAGSSGTSGSGIAGGAGIPGQGHDGGRGRNTTASGAANRTSGGGGGAGGAGSNGDSAPFNGTGGAGRSSSISGSSVLYATGGGRGGRTTLANSGDGSPGDSGGGSGIVIVRYLE